MKNLGTGSIIYWLKGDDMYTDITEFNELKKLAQKAGLFLTISKDYDGFILCEKKNSKKFQSLLDSYYENNRDDCPVWIFSELDIVKGCILGYAWAKTKKTNSLSLNGINT